MHTLHIYAEYTARPLSVIGALLGIVGICIMAFAWWNQWWILTKKERNIICGVVTGVCIVMMILSCANMKKAHLMYEVTINETYPAVELYSKFEIVEKRGDLWVLEKRPEVKEEKDKNEDSGSEY